MINDKLILNEIKAAIRSVDAGAEVILFGSRARGDFNEESDWDILILSDKADKERREGIFRKALLETEMKYSICIGLLVRSREKWDELEVTDIHQNIDEEGIVI